MWLRALFLMAVILILEGHVAGGYVRPATSMTRLATQPSVSLDRTDASRFRLNWNPFRQNFNKLFPATTTTTSTTRPAIQPSVSLHRTDASGFHFNWNFQEVFGSTIKKIELFAVPVNSDLGVANVSTVVFSNATSGSITTGLRPYTEYETAVVVTTNETTTTHPVKRAWTWGTAPSAPTDVTAKAVSSNSIVVSWSPSAQTNGILKPYRVCCTAVGTDWTRCTPTKDNATTSVEVKELRANMKYECYVEASTIPLRYQWRETLTSTSSTSTPVITWSETLQRLVIEQVMALSAHSLRVSWNKPRYVGGILGWFTVSIRPYIQGSGTKPEWRHVANVNADSGSHWISGLEPDTRYEVTVRGYVLPNDEGQGGGYNEYALPKIGLTWPSVPGVPANFQRSEPASGPRQTTAKPNGDTANITAYVTAKEANPEEPSVTHAAKTHANSSVEIKPYARNFTDVRAATAANEHDQGGEIGQLRATKPMTTNETGDANANTRLSSGATAGIVIACLVAVAVVVTAIVLTVRKAQKKFIIDADVYYNGIVNELQRINRTLQTQQATFT